MLRTRKIVKINDASSNQFGQYKGVYGQGESNFVYGEEALAQILTHQILTIRGEFSNRTNFGVNWFSNLSAKDQKTIYDSQIKQILVENPYVEALISFSSTYEPTTNNYSANFTLQTTEGRLQLYI